MEFISEEEIEQEIRDQQINVENLINQNKADAADPIKRETYIDKHEAYMALPRNVVWYLINACFKSDELNLAARRQLEDGTLSKISSAIAPDLKLSDAQKELPLRWLQKRIIAGWRSGRLVDHIEQLNKLTALSAQMEFIPYEDEQGEVTQFVLHKVRYNACPYLPARIRMRALQILYRFNGTSLVVRELPLNLHKAFTVNKTPFAPALLANKFLDGATKVFPRIQTIAQMALILDRNITTLINRMEAVDPKVAELIEPLTNQRSIFSGKVLSPWIEFFGGFATDDLGLVSVDRALASLPFKAYYGELSDVAIWKNDPVVLKVKSRLESIVPHAYMDYQSMQSWPAEACVYNPIPQQLNAYIVAAGNPAALAMPLASCITNSPQIDAYCRRAVFVEVTVLLCNPPVIVFQKCDQGLSGASMKESLVALERTIVRGFLMAAKDDYITRIKIMPGEGYSPDKLSVKFEFIKTRWVDRCLRYMSMTGKEQARFIPTARVQDVYFGNEKAADIKDAAFLPNYPRAFPTHLPQVKMEIGAAYNDLGLYTGKVHIDLQNWAEKMALDPEPVIPKRSGVKHGRMPAEQEPEEGEIPEPAPAAEQAENPPAAANDPAAENVPPAEGEPISVPAQAAPAEPVPMDVGAGEAYAQAKKAAEAAADAHWIRGKASVQNPITKRWAPRNVYLDPKTNYIYDAKKQRITDPFKSFAKI